MTRESSELRRLKAEVSRLRRELTRAKAKIRRMQAETVSIEDYEELSDLTGILTDEHVDASRKQRRGREKQAKEAVEPHARAQQIFDGYRAEGLPKARSRQFTSKALAKLHKSNPDVRVYTPGSLRKFLIDS